MSLKAFIVGAGAQGRVILDILRAQGRHDEIAFADENRALWGTKINGAMVEGGFDHVINAAVSVEAIVAIGHPLLREQIAHRLSAGGVKLLNAVHPSAVVMPTAHLGSGVFIAATAVVNSDAKVGDGAIINTGAIVEHDCEVGDYAAVSPGANLGGRVKLGKYAFVATGAIVLSRVQVGEGSVIGAGAVATRDVPANVLVMGVPARVMRRLGDDFDWRKVL